MVTICEGAKDIKTCLSTFAKPSGSLKTVALGIGCVACLGLAIHQGMVLKERSELSPKRERLALIVFSVAISIFITLAFFVKAISYPGLAVGYVCIGFLPHWIAKKVYPERYMSMLPWYNS